MNEHFKNMKEAVFSGQGGGLQGTSTAVGEMLAGNSDTRGSSQKKADDASTSLNDLANPKKGGPTTEGTSISARQQVQNMNTGTADHLDMAFRKQDS